MENVIVFDPSLDDLRKVVAETSKITAADLSDDAQMLVVRETRIKLRDMRVRIEKTGKTLRQSALEYQRNVITREKELLSVISDEEIRLKALEEQANTIKARIARIALLPMRREQLLPFDVTIGDEAILDMDNDQFVSYLVECQQKKNEQDRLAIEAEKAKLADDARLAQVKKDAETAERNRIEAASKANEAERIEKAAQEKRDAEAAAQKLVDDAKKEAERIAQEARDKIAQEAVQKEAAEREKAVREQQAKDEAAKKEAQAKFLVWAQGCGWDGVAGGFKTVHGAGGIELWKLVGTYTE
jgi:hypothetical protein